MSFWQPGSVKLAIPQYKKFKVWGKKEEGQVKELFRRSSRPGSCGPCGYLLDHLPCGCQQAVVPSCGDGLGVSRRNLSRHHNAQQKLYT